MNLTRKCPLCGKPESIEHAPVKRFVHPPADCARWAAVCLGIVRHYNEGWANGSRYGIRYWEIWNEPENRPAMWSGTDEDYFRLYRAAAQTLKQAYPDLKIGGPALGYSGRMEGGSFTPSEFVTNFLAMCRRENLPLEVDDLLAVLDGARAGDHADDRTHRRRRAFGHELLAQHAIAACDELHDRLVRLDLGEHVT